MTGEVYAIFAAFAYGVAGVAIVQGKTTAKGDNGVFLSVLITAILTLALWYLSGTTAFKTLFTANYASAIFMFALAGFFSIVLGRVAMYRGTEDIGAVPTALLRRLTPVFALPLGLFVLSEKPTVFILVGCILIISSVMIYLWKPSFSSELFAKKGLWLGIMSAAFYAVAYTLRSLGLVSLPDAALGTFIGAITGCLWFALSGLFSRNPLSNLKRLIVDRGRWQWLTAIALSIGQTLQFFSLKSTAVVTVATLGALEVFFSAAIGIVLTRQKISNPRRLILSGGLSVIGTIMLFW